jgi:SAD/SRA domain
MLYSAVRSGATARVDVIKHMPLQEKRSAYAPPPETSVRYDGIYRIAACWRKPGNQGPLVCRYLFVRADNEPAPWSTDGAPVGRPCVRSCC